MLLFLLRPVPLDYQVVCRGPTPKHFLVEQRCLVDIGRWSGHYVHGKSRGASPLYHVRARPRARLSSDWTCTFVALILSSVGPLLLLLLLLLLPFSFSDSLSTVMYMSARARLEDNYTRRDLIHQLFAAEESSTADDPSTPLLLAAAAEEEGGKLLVVPPMAETVLLVDDSADDETKAIGHVPEASEVV
jgi:hypothetical protein